MDASKIDSQTVNKVMDRLPPEARVALHAMSEMQNRSPEDVLRDEIKRYIEGRLPSIDIDGAMAALKSGAYQAGYFFGSLRKFARRMSSDE